MQGTDDLHPAFLGFLVKLPSFEIFLDIDISEITVKSLQELIPSLLLTETAFSPVLDSSVRHDAWHIDKGGECAGFLTLVLCKVIESEFRHIYILPLCPDFLNGSGNCTFSDSKTNQSASPSS